MSASLWGARRPRLWLGACPAGPAALASSLAPQQRVKPGATVPPGPSLPRVFPGASSVTARKAQSPARAPASRRRCK